MRVFFVTSNEDKVRELRELLKFPVESVKLDLPEIQGSRSEVSLAKATEMATAFQDSAAYAALVEERVAETVAVICEDTAMSFLGLGDDLPGPFIKFFLEARGKDEAGAERSREQMCRMLDGLEDRRARTWCTFGVAPLTLDGQGACQVRETRLVAGFCEGQVPKSARKADGIRVFGFDSIFEVTADEKQGTPPDFVGKTFAELTQEEKGTVSHRGRAAAKLNDLLAAVSTAGE